MQPALLVGKHARLFEDTQAAPEKGRNVKWAWTCGHIRPDMDPNRLDPLIFIHFKNRLKWIDSCESKSVQTYPCGDRSIVFF